MSYEGYFQNICANGHRFVSPVDYGGYGDDRLCDCGAESAWSNSVDQTNESGFGIIPDDLFLTLKLTDNLYEETCACCHSKKLVQAATYRIPTREEHQALRRREVQSADGQWIYIGLDELTDSEKTFQLNR